MQTHVPAEHYLSSGDYLSVVRDFALGKGIPLQTLLNGSELSHNDFINPPTLVNNFIITRIGINLFKELKKPLCEAAEFGLCMTASSHGSLGIAVQCASTLREAFSILTAFYNTRINSQDLHTTEQDGYIKAYLENKYEMTLDKELQRFFDLATLISIATNMYKALDHSALTGSLIIQVDAKEPCTFPFQQISGTNVLFDQTELALLIPAAWLDVPLSISNPDISKAALAKCADEMKLLSPSDLLSKVKRRIEEHADHIPAIDFIASEFCMSASTFKRKLKQQGTTYQELKDEIRFNRARDLISHTHLSFEEIAAQLGFSDASNFTKAFKNWTGQTPKQFREDASS